MTTATEKKIYTSNEVLKLTGLSYRDMGLWTKHGYLKGLTSPGSGHPRTWPLKMVLKAEVMVRLVKVGFTPRAASGIADRMMLEPETDGVARVDLGHDLFLYQDRSLSYVRQVLDMM